MEGISETESVIGSLWSVYCEMVPFVALGLFFAGLMHAFVKRTWVVSLLGNSRRGPMANILFATLLGVPLPVCSCGVIPMAVALKKQGASAEATTAFLISTPQTGVDSIIATYGILGPIFGTFRLIAAFVTGIAGGLMVFFFGGKGKDTSQDVSSADEEQSRDWKMRFLSVFTYGFGEMLTSLSVPLFFGIVAAGLIQTFLPDSFFTDYTANEWLQMGLVAGVSIPLYICSTAAIPVAALLIIKGLSPGAAFVLLTAGPVTNIAALFLIRTVFGTRQMVLFVITVIGTSMLFGWLMNGITAVYAPDLSGQMMCHPAELSDWKGVISILFSIPFALALYQRIKPYLISAPVHSCCHESSPPEK